MTNKESLSTDLSLQTHTHTHTHIHIHTYIHTHTHAHAHTHTHCHPKQNKVCVNQRLQVPTCETACLPCDQNRLPFPGTVKLLPQPFHTDPGQHSVIVHMHRISIVGIIS